MKREINLELEITQIIDDSHFNAKLDENVDVRKVVFKGDTITLAIKDDIDNHPLENLNKITDIGLKAQLTLKIGVNPQKRITDSVPP